MPSINIISPQDINFSFQSRVGDPIPFRRILSLIRAMGCKTIVIDEIDFPLNNIEDYCNRFNIIKRSIYKVYFFKTHFQNETDITKLTKDDLIGYCIIYNDKLLYHDKTYMRSYVFESIIKPIVDRNTYMINLLPLEINYQGAIFSIEGSYFCQQNGVTDSSAHATIRMSLRTFFPEINSELINKTLNLNDVNRLGNEGLTISEICNTIEQLTGYETLTLASKYFPSQQTFLKSIYHALDNRLPVILFFAVKGEGHAVTLIGFSYNNQNWWPRALMSYFSLHQEFGYTSSFSYCDNFVLQDDNFGPYFFLPVSSLKDIKESESFNFLELPFNFEELNISKSIKSSSLSAIIVHPKRMKEIKIIDPVEKMAFTFLKRYLDKREEKNTSNIKETSINLFKKYIKSGSLIFRTILLSKIQYLESIKNNKWLLHEVKEIINNAPEVIIVTELTTPDIFCCNKGKIGDIIINPMLFNEQRDSSAILIKLPGEVAFFDGLSFITVKLKDDNLIYPGIIPNNPFIET